MQRQLCFIQLVLYHGRGQFEIPSSSPYRYMHLSTQALYAYTHARIHARAHTNYVRTYTHALYTPTQSRTKKKKRKFQQSGDLRTRVSSRCFVAYIRPLSNSPYTGIYDRLLYKDLFTESCRCCPLLFEHISLSRDSRTVYRAFETRRLFEQ